MFACAAAALLVFPDGEAGVSAGAGFVPSQARDPGNITREQYRDLKFSAQLCRDLGGDLENDDRVCSNIDINDTFCLIGAGNALPCEGLFHHVNLCNTAYNRPALDPFHCAQACGGGEKALGRECRDLVAADEVVAASARITVYAAAEGFEGVGHEIEVSSGRTLVFAEIESDEYAIRAAAENNWEIEIIRPVAQSTVVATAVAKLSCEDCYPGPVSFSVSFAPLARPGQAGGDFRPSQGETLNGENIGFAAPSAPGNFTVVAVAKNGAAYAPPSGELEIDSAAGTLSGTLSAVGHYVVWAAYAASAERGAPGFFLGPMTLSLTVRVLPETLDRLDLDDVVADRTPSVFTAEGHQGPTYTLPVGAGYDLAYESVEAAGVAFDPASRVFSIPAENPLGAESRSATLTAAVTGCPSLVSTDCSGDPSLTVTLEISPVAAPAQTPLAAEYDDDFAHPLAVPEGLQDSPSLTVLGEDDAFAVSVSRPTILIRNPDDTPDAGSHRVTVGLTHANLIGILRLVVEAEISRAPLAEADWGLRDGDRSAAVTVAQGSGVEIHRAESRNPDGRAVPGAEADGLSQFASGNGVGFALDFASSALDGGTLAAEAVVTIRHRSDVENDRGNFLDFPQTVAIQATVIPAPEQTEVEGNVGVALFEADFVLPEVADYPGLSNALFADGDAADGFTVNPDGSVDGVPQAAGEVVISGNWTADGMLGTLALSLTVRVGNLSVVDLDDVILIRTPTLKAAKGFSGERIQGRALMVFSPVDDDQYTLSDPRADGENERFSFVVPPLTPDRGFLISVSTDHPIGVDGSLNEFGLTIALDSEISCEGCAPYQRISMTIVIEPVLPPTQNALEATYPDSFTHPVVFPEDYESTDGRRVTVLGVDGGEISLFSVSTPEGVLTGTNVPAGEYTVTVGFRHDQGLIFFGDFRNSLHLVGELAMEITADISPAETADADGIPLADRSPAEITVAFGHDDAVYAVTLASDRLVFGEVAARPSGFTLLRSADARTVTFALDGPVESGRIRSAVATLEIDSTDSNYAGLRQAVAVTVRSLAAPEVARPSPSQEAFAPAAIHNFRVGDYANATFSRASGDARLVVSEDGIVSLAPGETLGNPAAPGVYALGVFAVGPDFTGVAALSLELRILKAGEISPSDSIPENRRKVGRIIAGDYAGSVAFFAVGAPGVTLRTPASAPSGFGFPLDAAFLHPDGIAVSLTLSPPGGAVTVGEFAVVATREGSFNSTLTLAVTVSALARPPVPPVGIRPVPVEEGTQVFRLKSEDYEAGAYRAASFSEFGGNSASEALDVTTGDGIVEVVGDLEQAGVYGVTILATSPDPEDSNGGFFGVATLSVFLTVHWRLKFASGEGRGGVSAADADGNAVASGGLLGPGAVATLTADPAETHYVKGWRSAAEGLRCETGGPGDAGAPRECAVTLTADLAVTVDFAPANIPADAGVAAAERIREVFVAPGYSGEVAVFAAATDGATLRSPAAAPDGFVFQAETDFVAPAGLAVLLAGALPAESATVGAFNATLRLRDYAPTEIPLQVEVTALAAPAVATVLVTAGSAEAAKGAVLTLLAVAGFDDAEFSETGDAGDLFTVSADGTVAVSADGGLPEGIASLAVAATSPSFAFRGTLEFFLRAEVEPPRALISIAQSENGTVSAARLLEDGTTGAEVSSGDLILLGQTLRFTADPDDSDDFYVHSWSGCPNGGTGDSDDTGPQTCDILANDDLTVAAVFGRDQIVTYEANPPGGELTARDARGTILASGDGVHFGSPVTFAARASVAAGYALQGWTGDCASFTAADEICEVTADSAVQAGAVFALGRAEVLEVSGGGLRLLGADGSERALAAGDDFAPSEAAATLALAETAAGARAVVRLVGLDALELRGDSTLALSRLGREVRMISGGLALRRGEAGDWVNLVSDSFGAEVSPVRADLTLRAAPRAESAGRIAALALREGRVGLRLVRPGDGSTDLFALRCDDDLRRNFVDGYGAEGGYRTECYGDGILPPPPSGELSAAFGALFGEGRESSATVSAGDAAAEFPVSQGVEVGVNGLGSGGQAEMRIRANRDGSGARRVVLAADATVFIQGEAAELLSGAAGSASLVAADGSFELLNRAAVLPEANPEFSALERSAGAVATLRIGAGYELQNLERASGILEVDAASGEVAIPPSAALGRGGEYAAVAADAVCADANRSCHALRVSATVSVRAIPHRRGLAFQLNESPDGSGPGSCAALTQIGPGWRSPNLAEALGLGSDEAEVRVRSAGGSDIPGLDGGGGEITIRLAPPLEIGESERVELGGIGTRTEFYGRDSVGALSAVEVLERRGVGVFDLRARTAAGDYCVLPLAEDYARPADPAGICLSPDCAGAVAIDPAAEARTTLTLFAFRLDSDGATATVSAESGFSLTVAYASGAAVSLAGTVGDFVGGARTIVLAAPPGGLGEGEYAVFRATPQAGAAAEFEALGPLPATPLAIGEAAGIPAAQREPPLIRIAHRHAGLLHRATPASDEIRIAPESVPAEQGGLAAALAADGALEISTSPQASEVSAREIFEVTLVGVRPGLYAPRSEFVTIRVEEIAEPPRARISEDFPSGLGLNRAGAILATFAAENPDYAGAVFERVSGSESLGVSAADGVVSLVAPLARGTRHLLEFEARGGGANSFLGAQRFSHRVGFHFTQADVARVLPEQRPTVFAAANYLGAVYTVTVLDGGGLIRGAGLTLASPGWFLDRQTGEAGLASALSSLPDAGRVPQVGRIFLTVESPATGAGISPLRQAAGVEIAVRVVEAPQDALFAAAGDAFAHPIRLPGRFDPAGFAITILGAADAAGADATERFAISDAALAAGAASPVAGEYAVTLGLSHGGYLGTVAAEVAVVVGDAFGDIADGDEIPAAQRNPDEVAVSPTFVGLAHRAQAGAGVTLHPQSAPAGFAPLRPEGAPVNRLDFRLAEALGSLGGLTATVAVAQSRAGLLELATVVVTVSALAAPEELRVEFETVAEGQTLAAISLAGIPASLLAFREISDADNAFEIYSDNRTDERRNGEVAAVFDLTAGIYNYAVGISEHDLASLGTEGYPRFKGEVEQAVEIAVRPPIPRAQIFPPDFGYGFFVAGDFAGILTTVRAQNSAVSLVFPEEFRADFDARSDFGYDYDENAILLETPLGGNLRAEATLTLAATRPGRLRTTVEVSIRAELLGDLDFTVTVVPGKTGEIYDFAADRRLAGARFGREDSSSPELTVSAGGMVLATLELDAAGAPYTLNASAASDAIRGAARPSLRVEVSGETARRGLFYRRVGDGAECSSLGSGWRPPNLAEMSGLLVDGENVRVETAGAGSFSGIPAGGRMISLAALEADPGARIDFSSPGDDVGLRTSYPVLLDGARVAAAVSLTAGDEIRVVASTVAARARRYCVHPSAGYESPIDPAGFCFTADGRACLPSPVVLDELVLRAAPWDVLPVQNGASQRARILSERAGILAADAAPASAVSRDSALFSARTGAAAGGVLEVDLELARDLDAGSAVVATLAVSGGGGNAADLAVRFSGADGLRRGLRHRVVGGTFLPSGEGEVCAAMGPGWRVPGLAEAVGLRLDGTGATLEFESGLRVAGSEISVALAFSALADPPGARVGTREIQTDLVGVSEGVSGEVFGAVVYSDTPPETGLNDEGNLIVLPESAADDRVLARATGRGAPVCVRPDAPDSHARAADPAGVCIAPDCAVVGLLDGAADSRTLATIFAWRFAADGSRAAVSEAGYGLDFAQINGRGPAVNVETVGDFVGGARTVALVPQADFDPLGEAAEFLATPAAGAAATLRFGNLAFDGPP